MDSLFTIKFQHFISKSKIYLGLKKNLKIDFQKKDINQVCKISDRSIGKVFMVNRFQHR